MHIINNSIKLAKRLSILLLSIAMFACSDDAPNEPPADTEKPVVTITSPSETNIVYGTIQIKATATDNDAITKLQVFIDDTTTPIAEVTTASIDYTWDTRTVKEGEHTLRIVATDGTANTAEVKATVNVRNILLTFSVSANYLSEEDTYYIIVSDDKGTLLDNKKLENNSVYTLARPDGFTGKNITTTLYYYYNSESYKYKSLNTFVNIPLGNYGLVRTPPSPIDIPTHSIGEAKISVSGADYQSHPVELAVGGYVASWGTSSGTDPMEFVVNFFQNKQPILLSDYTTTPGKHLYDVIEPGNTYEYSINNMVTTDTKSITVPTDGDINISLWGRNDTYGSMLYYWPAEAPARQGSAISVPVIPEANFTSYQTQLTLTKADGLYVNFVTGPEIPTAMRKMEGNITATRQGSTLTLSNTEADFVVVNTYSDLIDNTITAWFVTAIPGTVVTIPQLPKELVDRHQLPEYAGLADKWGTWPTIYDYKDYNNLSDYMAREFNPNAAPPSVIDYTYYHPAPTGGRHGSRKHSPPFPSEKFQQIMNSVHQRFPQLPYIPNSSIRSGIEQQR